MSPWSGGAPGDPGATQFDIAKRRQLDAAVRKFAEHIHDHVELDAERRERLGQPLIRGSWQRLEVDPLQQKTEDRGVGSLDRLAELVRGGMIKTIAIQRKHQPAGEFFADEMATVSLGGNNRAAIDWVLHHSPT